MPALLIVTTMLTIVTFATALAHVLELPGKMRLERDTYLKVQTIYYPGFTVAGVAEPLSILACAGLAFLSSNDTHAFPFIVAAFSLLLLTHGTYWVLTHPVNGFWLADEKLGRAGEAFFGTAPSEPSKGWKELRNRWERSHLVRSILSGIAVIALLGAGML